ncbi:DUF6220 domain-containing protein [uncultured Nitratireductor sp.]|uniref:DUF6220 domain-containing protein n=1 Tax=uncultured Nitratireductor sp. TaxID=520953 RepID=UPI0025DB51EA|nr:DUF6220 domain-containing protein [uncultured Nitratireductor sp.]
MATKIHDTFIDLERGTPGWFTWSARLLPAGLLAQFLSAGTALFQDGALWGVHAGFGGVLAIPALVLVGGALSVSRLRGFGWWAGLVFLLYLVQVVLAAGSKPLPLSFHPFNGALLLTASLVLLAKVERRRAQPVTLHTQ